MDKVFFPEKSLMSMAKIFKILSDGLMSKIKRTLLLRRQKRDLSFHTLKI